MEFKVGDRVIFATEKVHYFHPPFGTIGKVLEVWRNSCFVQWPKGSTCQDDIWPCNKRWLGVLYRTNNERGEINGV